MRNKSLALTLLLGISFMSCTDKHIIPHAEKESGEPLMQEFIGNTQIIMTDSGHTEWLLTTTHMKKRQNDNKTIAIPVGFDYYDGKEKPQSHVAANYGETVGSNFEDFLVKGKVRVTSLKGYKLKAEDLHWNKRANKITSEGRVYFTTLQGDVLTGIGFASDPDLENWQILKDVTGVFQKFEKRMDKGGI